MHDRPTEEEEEGIKADQESARRRLGLTDLRAAVPMVGLLHHGQSPPSAAKRLALDSLRAQAPRRGLARHAPWQLGPTRRDFLQPGSRASLSNPWKRLN